MKISTFGVAILSSVTLIGCGGSSIGSVTSVFASSAAIVPGDYVGKTFPIRFIGAREDAGIVLLRGTGSITIVTDDIVELTVDGRTYTLTYNGLDDLYESPDAVAEIAQEYPEIVTGLAEDLDSLYLGAYGFETASGDMPMTDLFSYYDPTGSALFATDGVDFDAIEGAVDLYVNFGSGAVFGDVYASSGFAISVGGGTIGSSGFSGTLTATSDLVDVPLSSSDVDGTFFGSEADTLFGTFEGEFADPADVGGVTGFVGGFLADKSPV